MNTCMHTLLLAGSFWAVGLCASAQDSIELGLLAGHYTPADQKTIRAGYTDQQVTGFIGISFYIYKNFISSQDHMSCVFAPSCSEYAVHAIQKQGIIPGLMNTFDRLTRCNGLRPQDYKVDPRLQRLIDPVRNVRYEEL
jgi:uncharacterized protein